MLQLTEKTPGSLRLGLQGWNLPGEELDAGGLSTAKQLGAPLVH